MGAEGTHGKMLVSVAGASGSEEDTVLHSSPPLRERGKQGNGCCCPVSLSLTDSPVDATILVAPFGSVVVL